MIRDEARGLVFVHGGIDPKTFPNEHDEVRMWTRSEKFFRSDAGPIARRLRDILVVHGHTPTHDFEPDVQRRRINVDTGACFGGPLTSVVLAPDQAPRFLALLDTRARAAAPPEHRPRRDRAKREAGKWSKRHREAAPHANACAMNSTRLRGAPKHAAPTASEREVVEKEIWRNQQRRRAERRALRAPIAFAENERTPAIKPSSALAPWMTPAIASA